MPFSSSHVRCQTPDGACGDVAAGAAACPRYDRTVAATTPESYLEDLNPAQREAVLTTEGPLLVIAGAGSGKTRVLTRRIAHLLRAVGVKPPEILAITFTNKAAAEMRERVERLVGPPARAAWVMTFHAACGRILRREAERLGYRSNFTIYDSADQIRLTKHCLEELDRDPKRFTPRGIHSQISNAKNQLVGPGEYGERVASFYDQTVAEVYDLYQRCMFGSNAVDFDDLLMLAVQVLERFPEARDRWQKAFRYVLVDEYQDTNHAQYRLLQRLAQKHRTAFAVRDPQDRITQYRGLMLDITELKNFQAELQRERDFNSKILNNTSSMILVVDTAGLISYGNRRCLDAGAYSQAELLGRPLGDLVAPGRRPALGECLRPRKRHERAAWEGGFSRRRRSRAGGRSRRSGNRVDHRRPLARPRGAASARNDHAGDARAGARRAGRGGRRRRTARFGHARAALRAAPAAPAGRFPCARCGHRSQFLP